jgi:hypothetical protein
VLHQQATQAHVSNVLFSAPEIADYRENNHTLDAVVEYHSMDFLLLARVYRAQSKNLLQSRC